MPGPDFLLIGAAKAGTTALFETLRRHPQIYMPRNKEPGYFTWVDRPLPIGGPGDRAALAPYAVTNWDDYLALFAGRHGEPVAGEASTVYLYDPDTASRIADLVPSVRLIAVLRQPADRAYAAYLHLVRDGRESMPFAEALAAEPERVAAGWEPLWHYRAMGRYGEQLARYLACFPRAQLHVVLFERWRADPVAVLTGICRFLSIDPALCPPPAAKTNPGGIPRHPRLYAVLARPSDARARLRRWVPTPARAIVSRRLRRWPVTRPALDPALWRELTDGYRADIAGLEAQLGLDLSIWFATNGPN